MKAAAAPQAAKPRAAAALIGVAVMIAAFGIVPFLLMDGCSSTEGTLVASGQPLGDVQFAPSECRSGQHQGFFGVFLLAKNGQGELRVVHDAVRDTWVVHAELPGKPRLTLDTAQCSSFDVRVERSNTTVNDIRLLDGHLNLACQLKSGSITSNIRFEGCD